VGCLAFLALPALLIGEIYAFVWVAGQIGWIWALIALVASMSLGGSLVRQAGFQAMTRARDALNRGEAPARSLFDGACLLAAGALFVFPGFLTDVVAILLLLPPARWVLFRLLSGGARRRAAAPRGPMGGSGAGPAGGVFGGRPHVFVWSSGSTPPPRPSNRGTPSPEGVIDAEWTEVPEDGGPDGQRGLPAGDVGESDRSKTLT
jgi:UPF0716 protein FxsA